MTDRDLHIHMARAFLHQALVVRQQGIHHGWHATLLRWAAARRRRAMKPAVAAEQLDLFA